MKVGGIWICNYNCCFGVERDFPHYAKILGFLPKDIIEYCLINIENGELEPMITGMSDDNGDTILYYDYMPRTEFLKYYNKLRDSY